MVSVSDSVFDAFRANSNKDCSWDIFSSLIALVSFFIVLNQVRHSSKVIPWMRVFKVVHNFVLGKINPSVVTLVRVVLETVKKRALL